MLAMTIEIHSSPCACPPDYCAHFVEPPAHCINRLDGEVMTRHCEVCNPGGSGATWHQNGQCLKCRAILMGREAD
jgi:hypothetical protein